MKIMLSYALGLLALAHLGCSSGSGGTPTSNGTAAGTATTQPPDAPGESPDQTVVNGQPADEYYGQFANDEKKTYLSGAAAFPAQANGDNLFVATLFLMKDRTFFVFYTEGAGEVTLSGHAASTRTDKNRKVTGSYTLKGGRLLLGDAMTCAGLTMNGKPSLACQLVRPIGYEAAVGKVATFSASTGKSPTDSTFAEFP